MRGSLGRAPVSSVRPHSTRGSRCSIGRGHDGCRRGGGSDQSLAPVPRPAGAARRAPVLLPAQHRRVRPQLGRGDPAALQHALHAQQADPVLRRDHREWNGRPCARGVAMGRRGGGRGGGWDERGGCNGDPEKNASLFLSKSAVSSPSPSWLGRFERVWPRILRRRYTRSDPDRRRLVRSALPCPASFPNQRAFFPRKACGGGKREGVGDDPAGSCIQSLDPLSRGHDGRASGRMCGRAGGRDFVEHGSACSGGARSRIVSATGGSVTTEPCSLGSTGWCRGPTGCITPRPSCRRQHTSKKNGDFELISPCAGDIPEPRLLCSEESSGTAALPIFRGRGISLTAPRSFLDGSRASISSIGPIINAPAPPGSFWEASAPVTRTRHRPRGSRARAPPPDPASPSPSLLPSYENASPLARWWRTRARRPCARSSCGSSALPTRT